MESSTRTVCTYYSDFFLVSQLHNSGLQSMLLNLNHLRFTGRVDTERFQQQDIRKGQFQFLVTFLADLIFKLNQSGLYTTTFWTHIVFSVDFQYLYFRCLAFIRIFSLTTIYNQFYNMLRLFDVLPNFPFTTSETMCDYYL